MPWGTEAFIYFVGLVDKKKKGENKTPRVLVSQLKTGKWAHNGTGKVHHNAPGSLDTFAFLHGCLKYWGPF